ncbi:MAG: hypothetical protein K6U87_04160 [Firmicutes bacterium]|nr:hypothetical protein [Bacillota bacterium]
MATLLVSGIEGFLLQLVQGMLTVLGQVGSFLAVLAAAQLHLPWVATLRVTLESVAWTLLGLDVGYTVLTRYILWSEGTADPDGSILWKGIVRAVLYGGLSAALVPAVFTFGADLAATIAASAITGPVQTLQGWVGQLTHLTADAGELLAVALTLAATVAVFVILLVQMAVRAAELVVYYLAAPFVALGQLQPDGGVWNGWWANLVILSLSQAWQVLCLKGATATAADVFAGASGQAAGNLIVGLTLEPLLLLGWIIVAIRGPHLLRQWSYRTGVGGAMVWAMQRMVAARLPLGGGKGVTSNG